MFRTSAFTSMYLAAALGIVATGSAVTSASAASSRVFVDHIAPTLPHVHLITSPQNSSVFRPSKKKPG